MAEETPGIQVDTGAVHFENTNTEDDFLDRLQLKRRWETRYPSFDITCKDH